MRRVSSPSVPSPTSSVGRQPNQRGLSTRSRVLDAALQLLAGGRPESASANLVAKEAGVTWGTVQYQFGDADGLWSAVLSHILDTAGPVIWARPSATSPAGRVSEVIELLWNAMDSPYHAAMTTLRGSLARDRAELERGFPRTAAAMDALDDNWTLQFAQFFEGIDVDPRRASRVCALLPSALRGLRAEQEFGSPVNITEALAGLRDSLTLYLLTPASDT